MDKLQAHIQELIKEKFSIEPVSIPAELATISFPLGLLNIRCYNWQSKKIRKIYFMRMSLKIRGC
jgi:hypothetical protein